MGALSSALRELEAIVGEGNLLTGTEEVTAYRLEGQMPLAVAFPRSPQQVAALLKAASTAGLSVLIRGAGRHLHLGAPPGPIGLVVSLERLDHILEYDADDLTITVEAGVTLEALQRVVGQKGQIAPLDPPGPHSATIGGIAATNLTGPLRLRHGSLRDLVLGLRVALCDGSVVKTGGRTVKNVAGYDLTKLFVGSLGTLGAICQLTLRLVPLLEARAIIIAPLPASQAAEGASQIAGSWLEPASLEIADPRAVERLRGSLPMTTARDRWLVFTGLLGDPEAIAGQEREIRSLLSDGCVRVDGEGADRAWQELRSLAYPSHPMAALLRVCVPMARVAEVMDLISSWEGWWTLARPTQGTIYVGLSQEGDMSQTKQRLVRLRKQAEERGGFAILEFGPPELKRDFPVWGDQPANLDLMTSLKHSYDPAGILGCGRFLPGL